MYRMNNKAAAVREIQRFLLVVAQRNMEMPHITVDGVYSEETAEAVRIFQRSREIDTTGKVDFETFQLLFSEAKEITENEERKGRVVSHESFPLKLGSSGVAVASLNNLLRELSVYYPKSDKKPFGSFYSRDTYDWVILMQRQLLEEESGEVSLRFFDMLTEELISRKTIANL